MDIERLIADLQRDEGVRLKPYRDTVGKMTIGVGRNLDDRGITEVEAGVLLATDIGIVADDLDRNIPWWRDLPEPARRGLANMAFNLGWPRLAQFHNMLDALQNQDFPAAAKAALASKWAIQVGSRARRIAKLYEDSQ